MLNKNNFQFVNKVKDWREAITKAGNILEENEIIRHDYIIYQARLYKRNDKHD